MIASRQGRTAQAEQRPQSRRRLGIFVTVSLSRTSRERLSGETEEGDDCVHADEKTSPLHFASVEEKIYSQRRCGNGSDHKSASVSSVEDRFDPLFEHAPAQHGVCVLGARQGRYSQPPPPRSLAPAPPWSPQYPPTLTPMALDPGSWSPGADSSEANRKQRHDGDL